MTTARPFDPRLLERMRDRFHYPDQAPMSGPRVFL